MMTLLLTDTCQHILPRLWQGLLAACLLSVSHLAFAQTATSESSATEQTAQPEAPSFFGGRAVTQAQDNSEAPVIEFQRRSIAPAIPVELPTKTAQLQQKNKTINPLTAEPEGSAIELSREDLLLLKKARYYIDRNWNDNTGLIDSVQGYSHATMWDVGSSIGAILALEHLGQYNEEKANAMLEKTIATLASFPLYRDKLPNRQYNTKTGNPSGSYSTNSTNGDGWSALDIGRLLIWLTITAEYKPELKPKITALLSTWDLERSVYKGTLYGEQKYKSSTSYRQEGRLGYLQYAAQGFAMQHLNVDEALGPKYSQQVFVDDYLLFIDIRNLPYFTTDPYVLQAIELGSHDVWWNQLDSLYEVQRDRYDHTRKLTIFAEDSLSQRPWFAYNNVHFYGKNWLSTSAGGKPIENGQMFSNKVAFGLSMLFKDSFSRLLYNTVVNNSVDHRSIPTGLYKPNSPNTAYNINTNSLILVSLWYKKRGYRPIWRYEAPLPLSESELAKSNK
ncbi:hypothetical protein C9I91_06200 [Photobacterium jeanii]|nr:hypothetical protein C9I91_06200 [Photobacterium jeanii]